MMNYFFYKDYMFNKWIRHSNPLVASSSMISLIEGSNLIAISYILNRYLLHLKYIPSFEMASYILLAIVLMIINVMYFTKHEKQICHKYKGESSLKNILGYVVYVGYAIGSIALVLWLIKIKCD